jgi:two-component system cell cycle sensor histidine kinase/response regulator CckA
MLAKKTLERFGYRVLVAADGVEALALYIRHQDDISLVLTDMAMPRMDGPALIVALNDINPQVRIIGSSGLTSAEALGESLGGAVAEFVRKPYTTAVLLETLRRALNNAHATTSPSG